MKQPAAFVLALAAVLAGCAPYPVYVAQPPVPLTPAQRQECAVIRSEIARQQRIAQLSPVMATLLVEGAVRLNTYNVVAGLEQRAAIEGCPLVYGLNGVYGRDGRHRGPASQYKV